MPSWLEEYAPRRFDELAFSEKRRSVIESAAISSNPPHILLAGPPGIGKTAAWRLMARQILGPGWRSTTHVLQAKDLKGTSGAMANFENFLRPGGNSSSDTLAGRSSLDAFDSSIISASENDPPPSGRERFNGESRAPISRLIIIEDADHLSFVQGGGHGGSHPHMVHEVRAAARCCSRLCCPALTNRLCVFRALGMICILEMVLQMVSALAEDRQPWPNAAQSANWTAVGILAHESAMAGGEMMRLPEFTLE